MELLSPDIIKDFAFNSIPGTAFVKIEGFTLSNRVNCLLLLSFCHTVDGFTRAAYTPLVQADGKWHLCPWLHEDIHSTLCRLASPNEMFNRLSDDLKQAAASLITVEEYIKRETARAESLVAKVKEAEVLIDRLEELKKQNG